MYLKWDVLGEVWFFRFVLRYLNYLKSFFLCLNWNYGGNKVCVLVCFIRFGVYVDCKYYSFIYFIEDLIILDDVIMEGVEDLGV